MFLTHIYYILLDINYIFTVTRCVRNCIQYTVEHYILYNVYMYVVTYIDNSI